MSLLISTIVPHNYAMPMETVRSFLNLNGYDFHIQEGPSLPDNRNEVVRYAKLTGKDLLFIDADIVFTPEDVAKIEEHLKSKDIVTGIYVIGRGLYSPCLFKRTGPGDYEKMEIPKEVCEIGACGGGFLGVSAEALQKLGDDPFTNIWNEDIQHGEDISFCQRAYLNGLKVWVDPTILLGHVRNKTIYP